MNPAISKITSMQRDVRVWQVVSLFQALLFTAVIAYGKFFPAPQPDILIVHDGGYIIGKLEDFSEASLLHEEQSEIAALCLFQRSPNGLDYEDRLKRLATQRVYDKAVEMVRSEMNEFRLKSLHQKLEIFEISNLPVRGNTVLSSLKGQLIRTGSFEGKDFIEVLALDLKMQFIRNPGRRPRNC